MTDLVPFEQALAPLVPRMRDLLPVAIAPETINQTVLHALSQNAYLARADVGSVQGCAISAAVLGLQVDGFTGQGYMLPFKSKNRGVRAQFLVGYKGLVTLGHRADRTIRAGVVLDGDEFEADEGAGTVVHKRVYGKESKRQIIAAWASASSLNAPPVAIVLSYDEILERRERSPSWRAKPGEGPWATDFRPMARKSAVHALAAFVPVLPLQLASSLETHHNLGRHAQIDESKNVVVDDDAIEGEVVEKAGPAGAAKPTEAGRKSAGESRRPAPPGPAAQYRVSLPGGEVREFTDVESWVNYMRRVWSRAQAKGLGKELADLNVDNCVQVAMRHQGSARAIYANQLVDQMNAAREGGG